MHWYLEKKNKNCPSNCHLAQYQKCLGKEEILSKLQFKCIKCDKEIPYKETEKHHIDCCPNRNLKILRVESKEIIAKKKVDNNKNIDKKNIIKSKLKIYF